MNRINFTITLTSDAEPASGFGTELTDSLLPRNIKKRVVLPSTHLKGIIRENLENLTDSIIPIHAVTRLFGSEGKSEALFHISDAVAPEDAVILDVQRTQVNDCGTAADHSLRTSEAVACGTRFTGAIKPHPRLSSSYRELIKLGLLSLFAVGGGRNRGAGACYVSLLDETSSPGNILKEVAEIDFSKFHALQPQKKQTINVSDEQTTLKLVFQAANPVCVPETPIVRNNIIRSGFTIPASAVQGAILHRINDISEPVATACYNDKKFRAWPLNPSDNENASSLRVSFTHKISKLKLTETGDHHFEDSTVQSYDWNKIPENSPLKSADGVLLASGSDVKLWKSSEMARILSAHGVHNGDRSLLNTRKRNLFSVESMAPMLFTGFVSMPKTAAEILVKSLEDDSFVQLGKSRSVRGGGSLRAEIVSFESLPIFTKNEPLVFIVQSPLLIPEQLVDRPCETIISKLVEDAGFGEVEEAAGAVTILFGWNRTIKNGLLSGKPVIAPGAVFKLKSTEGNLKTLLISGIGDGREQGFGAVLPHPGIAQELFPKPPEPRRIKKPSKNYGMDGYKLWKTAKQSGLSASQISRVRELSQLDPHKAIEYLKRQRLDRPDQIWNKWKDVTSDIEEGLRTDPLHMVKALKICQDLLVADKGGN